MDETLIALGSPVKALGGDRVGGLLVRFTGSGEKDLQGEYFTKETDFWGPPEKVHLVYHHGFSKALGRQRIGSGELTPTAEGLAIEAKVSAPAAATREAKAAVKATLDDAHAGKLGWSSGSAPHLVVKAEDGRIVQWPLIEASLTKTPVDPRARVVPIKSILPAGGGGRVRTVRELRDWISALKAGRVLSAGNRARLKALREALVPALADLDALLSETEPAPAKAGPFDPDSLAAALALAELEAP